MDLTIVAERISQKISQKGKNVDQKEIEAKLRLLVDEFGVQPAEAERTVINESGASHQVPGLAGAVETDRHAIAELVPEEWVTIEGKVVGLSAPNSPSIAQTGIIADASGSDPFRRLGKGWGTAPRAGPVVPGRVGRGRRVPERSEPEDTLGDNRDPDRDR